MCLEGTSRPEALPPTQDLGAVYLQDVNNVVSPSTDHERHSGSPLPNSVWINEQGKINALRCLCCPLVVVSIPHCLV